jgi:hypothetical protein
LIELGPLGDQARCAPRPSEIITLISQTRHLIDPQAVLRQAKTLLVPTGFLVVSLPHIGHADVRLSLLQGRLDNGEWGLLENTHLLFFALKTIREGVDRSGFLMTELNRVRVPAFETELKVDRSAVPTVVLDAVLSDTEAETYQFVPARGHVRSPAGGRHCRREGGGGGMEAARERPR